MSAVPRVAAVAWLESLRLRRTPTTFTLLILVPLLQVLLFGYAIRPQPATLSVAIAAPQRASVEALAQVLNRDPDVRIVAIGDVGDAVAAVRSGRARLGIEIPAMRSFAFPDAPVRPIHVVIDTSDASLAVPAEARAQALYWRYVARRARVESSEPGITVERLYNPQARADWSFIPALVGVTVMIAAIMLGAIGLAREREVGTWEALLALPTRRWEILAGKTLPFLIIGLAQGVIVLAAGRLLFDLPLRGAVWALLALLPLYAAAHLVLGQAIAARAKSQMAALQGAVAFYLPAMLLSGFLYPREAMPAWAQALGSAFPLTHFIAAARACLLRGADAAAVLSAGAPILAFLVCATIVALATGRQID
ncbi:MAG: ABC transporter permease [Sphingomonadaceae bacterium]|nr:ABC transporter permease [Sphingomonadaceae bacterium]